MNVDKTKLTLFRSKRKQIIKYLNFRISGQKINTPNKVKYLGMQMEQHLDWNVHIKNIVPKLNRPIGILSKIRHHVHKFLLKTIYYSIFNSHLIYACYLFNTHLISKLQCNIFFQPLGRGRECYFLQRCARDGWWEMCPRRVATVLRCEIFYQRCITVSLETPLPPHDFHNAS